MKITIALFGLLASTCQVTADYSTETGVAFIQDDSDLVSIDGLMLGFLHHFQPVKTSKIPKAFADTYANVSSIGFATVINGNVDYDIQGTIISGNFSSMMMAAEYSIKNTPYMVSLSFMDMSLDANYQSTRILDSNFDGITFGIKYFQSDELVISTSIEKNDQIIRIEALNSETNIDSTVIGFEASKLIRGKENLIDLNGRIELIKSSDDSGDPDTSNTKLSGTATFLTHQNIAIGGMVAIESGSDNQSEGRTLGINILTFPSDSITLEFEFEKFSAEDSEGEDSNSLLMLVNGQF